MKKVLFLIGIMAISLFSFAQEYDEDKLPSGLITTTTLDAEDYLVIQKNGESYVKAIQGYYSYLYYKRMLDSIVDLNVSGDLDVQGDIDANWVNGIFGSFTTLQVAAFLCTNLSYFTDMVEVQDTLYTRALKMWPTDTISNSYALVLDPTDSIVKIAPMSVGDPQVILNNRVAHVNYNLSESDYALFIFKTYADAYNSLFLNGYIDANNTWTIVMPSGYCNEDIELYPYVSVYGNNSIIKSVTSTVTFTGPNIWDGRIQNCSIQDLLIAEGKQYYIENCIVGNIEPVPTDGDGYVNMQNSTFLGGDFSNTTWIIPPENNKYLAIYSDITGFQTVNNMPILSSVFGEGGSSITSMPSSMHNCTMTIASTSETKNIYFRNCVINIDTLTTSGGIKATNSSLFIDELNISSSNTGFYFCEISGNKNLTGSGTHNFNHCTLNAGDLVANDTVSVSFKAGCYVGGKTEFNDTSRLIMYQDAEIEDLTINDSATATDMTSVFGEIHYNDGSTAQTIPTGTTYTKWTAFTDVGDYNLTTPAADSIVITIAGEYFIAGQFSTSCGTNAVQATTALFVNGMECNTINKIAAFSTQNSVQSGSISGIIQVTPAMLPCTIDVRKRHDQGGDINFTGIYGNLVVYKIGRGY